MSDQHDEIRLKVTRAEAAALERVLGKVNVTSTDGRTLYPLYVRLLRRMGLKATAAEVEVGRKLLGM